MNRPSPKRQVILRWVGTLLSIVLLVYLFSQQGWEEIIAAIRQIGIWRFLTAFVFVLISRLAVIGRWHILLRGANVAIPIRQSARITMAGLFASNFLPTTVGGDVVRLAGAVRLGYDEAISLASLIIDRLVGMAGMFMALLTLPFTMPGIVYHPGSNQYTWFTPPVLLVGASIHSTWWRTLANKVLNALTRMMLAVKLWLKHPRYLFLALIATWVHMLCIFAQIWILLQGMGQPLPFGAIAGLWSLTYFITLLPVSINGMGVQELSTTLIFTSLGGVSATASLTLALLIRVLQMLASLPGALYIPGILAGDQQVEHPI